MGSSTVPCYALLYLSTGWNNLFFIFPSSDLENAGRCWESWEMLGGLPSRKKKNSGDFLGEKSWRNHLQCWHIGKLATRHDRTLKHSRCHSSQMFVTIVHPRKTGWQTDFLLKQHEAGGFWPKNASTCYVLKLGKVLIMILVSKTVTISQNQNQSSWWFQPLWKILVKLEIFPN